jgi:hypothetical protein
VRTWLNAVRYYIPAWFSLFKTWNSKDNPYNKWPGGVNFILRIPTLTWKKYYAQRKELLEQAAATYKHYQDYLADSIKECPNCGQKTYMKVGTTFLYRCYTCNDTPKEWR